MQFAAKSVCSSTTSTLNWHEETPSFYSELQWGEKKYNSHKLNQTVFQVQAESAGQGQTVNNQSRPFKCQLSWKQVQKWRIWKVAEQPGSHRLATPKNNSEPSECHPAEPRCSTEALKAAIQAN